MDHPKNVVCVNQPKCREAADTLGVWIPPFIRISMLFRVCPKTISGRDDSLKSRFITLKQIFLFVNQFIHMIPERQYPSGMLQIGM